MAPQRPRRGSSPDREQPSSFTGPSGQRLQKVLAAAGIASRRACETLILEGRVEVDGQTVTVLGTCVDPRQQEIRVDGMPLTKPRHVYYLVNKPAGVVSTHRDPSGRARVIDLVPSDQRLFTIGRLDRSSEGMIIVTNDGELAHHLSHPRYAVTKTYRAQVLGTPTHAELEQLRKGVQLAEGRAHVAALKVCGKHARGVDLELVLMEGRNREIRRMLAKVGHKVQRLKRVAMGPIRLGQLRAGEYRPLTRDEVRLLSKSSTLPRRQGAEEGQRPASGGARAKRARTSQAAARAGRARGTSPRKGTDRSSQGRPFRSPDEQQRAKSGVHKARPPRTGTVLGGHGEGRAQVSRKKVRRARKQR